MYSAARSLHISCSRDIGQRMIKTQTLPAGSFFALPPGMAHYVFTDEETVVQISTVGPWGLTCAKPKDDPRQKTQ